MEEEIYIIIFQRPCIMGCSDIEIRLCKAPTIADAKIIALHHRDTYFKGWAFEVRNVIWSGDNTAYVYCEYN